MERIIFLLFVAHSSLRLTDAAVSIAESEADPDYPDHCFISSTGQHYQIESSWPMENDCGEVRCGKYDSRLFLYFATCGTVDGPPHCELISDLSRPYPQCCPEPKCPEKMDSSENVKSLYDVSSENFESDDINVIETLAL